MATPDRQELNDSMERVIHEWLPPNIYNDKSWIYDSGPAWGEKVMHFQAKSGTDTVEIRFDKDDHRIERRSAMDIEPGQDHLLLARLGISLPPPEPGTKYTDAFAISTRICLTMPWKIRLRRQIWLVHPEKPESDAPCIAPVSYTFDLRNTRHGINR